MVIQYWDYPDRVEGEFGDNETVISFI